MIAGDMLSQLLLITGWAVQTEGAWSVFDPAPGDASAWRAATMDEAAALDATLATYPTIAAIHAGRIAQLHGHRASCASLHPLPCNCGVTP